MSYFLSLTISQFLNLLFRGIEHQEYFNDVLDIKVNLRQNKYF